MIEKLCLLLLRLAARRWQDNGEMLAEWRAELSTMDKGRFWYAASLAVSRPHRVATLAPRRAVRAVVISFMLLLTLPALFDLWQPWMAAGGAVVLGLALARLTAGLTNVIKPALLSTWVFGVLFLYMVELEDGLGFFLQLIWPAAGIVLGFLVVRLTRRGRTAMAWTLVLTAPVIMLAPFALPLIIRMLNGSFPVAGSEIPGFVIFLVANPFLHMTLFALVYLRGLAIRVTAPAVEVA